jgi:two-component system sensor histidine kinase AgrC
MNVILNTIDFVNYYIVFSKITHRKNALAKINIIFILLCGIIMGSVPTLLPSEKYMFIQRIIFLMVIFLSIHILHNNKSEFYDSIVIFGLLTGWVLFINIGVIFILENLHFNSQISLFLTGQFLIFAIVLITLFLPIDNLYKISKKNITTEYMICFLSIIYLGYYFKVKFDPRAFLKEADIMIYIMIVSAGFFWKKLVQYEKENKMYVDYYKMMKIHMDSVIQRQHKVDNVISTINGSLAMANNLEELKMDFKKYASMVEIDEELKKILTSENKYIVAFIQAKKQLARENEMDILTDIEYVEECKVIPEHILIVDILGELLENAIQNSKKGTLIRVRMKVEKLSMHLEVENRHNWIDPNTKQNIFKKGYSLSKNMNFMRGYGLSNVIDAVKAHHGSVQLINTHDEDKNRIVIFKILIFE